jgi:hypothetical protein
MRTFQYFICNIWETPRIYWHCNVNASIICLKFNCCELYSTRHHRCTRQAFAPVTTVEKKERDTVLYFSSYISCTRLPVNCNKQRNDLVLLLVPTPYSSLRRGCTSQPFEHVSALEKTEIYPEKRPRTPLGSYVVLVSTSGMYFTPLGTCTCARENGNLSRETNRETTSYSSWFLRCTRLYVGYVLHNPSNMYLR